MKAEAVVHIVPGPPVDQVVTFHSGMRVGGREQQFAGASLPCSLTETEGGDAFDRGSPFWSPLDPESGLRLDVTDKDVEVSEDRRRIPFRQSGMRSVPLYKEDPQILVLVRCMRTLNGCVRNSGHLRGASWLQLSEALTLSQDLERCRYQWDR